MGKQVAVFSTIITLALSYLIVTCGLENISRHRHRVQRIADLGEKLQGTLCQLRPGPEEGSNR
jgi:hypothetical protein